MPLTATSFFHFANDCTGSVFVLTVPAARLSWGWKGEEEPILLSGSSHPCHPTLTPLVAPGQAGAIVEALVLVD